MEKTSNFIINYLPEDLLCQICSHLDCSDLKSTSLVSKLFCSLSSLHLHKLLILEEDSSCSDFQRLFNRFPCVTEIRIDCPKLDNALLSICNSDLNLEKLQVACGCMNAQYPEPQTIVKLSTSRVFKSIKSLQLNWYEGRTISQVTEFINLFPSLTELNISYGYLLDDIIIDKLTMNLPNLLKINLSCNHLLTDMTLDLLSSNCPKLETVNFQRSERFTPEGLYKFFCNNPQLNSVCMPSFRFLSISEVVKCVQVLQNLNHLSLEYDFVQDAVLIALAESRPPLKSLVIRCCLSQNYTMTGLSRLLSTCPELESLEVDLPDVENCSTHDADMSIVVKTLRNLKHIMVSSRVVCQATLFSLIQNCPLLETILFMRDSEGRMCDQGMARPTKKNYSIKSIDVYPKSDTWLHSTIEPYCPSLSKELGQAEQLGPSEIHKRSRTE